jgi:hypothetical protein
MNMSFFGDMQSETTLQIEQAPFEKPVHPETSASQTTFRQVTLQFDIGVPSTGAKKKTRQTSGVRAPHGRGRIAAFCAESSV